MIFKRLALICFFTLLLCSCQHASQVQNNDGGSLSLHGADVEGLDDPLESRIVVKVGSIGMNLKGGAHFFRGYIDKATVAPVYQLYVQTKESEWCYWDEARYLAPEGVKQWPVSRVGTDVRCSQWGCVHYEDIIVKIDRPTLLNWSKNNTDLRLYSSKVSSKRNIEVSEGDAKDFLDAMDEVVTYLTRKQSASTANKDIKK